MTTAMVLAFDARSRSRGAVPPGQPLPADAVRAAWETAVLDAEDEAGRRADALHDGLMQSLVVVRHALALERSCRVGAAPTSAAADLPDPDTALRSCLAEARSVVWHLRPRITAGTSLGEALDELAVRLTADGGPLLDYEVGPDAGTPAQAVVVYRLVQAHALAAASRREPSLTVRVARHGESLVVHVSGPADDADAELWASRGTQLGVHVERAAG